jgi:beta-N-acetylhexosaminidase
MLAAILGLGGEALSDDERRFFADADPAGFILFARNVRDRAQVRALTDELRSLAGRDDLPILIDQEGGRVARLRPPVWPEFPPGWRFAELYRKAPISAMEAARVNALALALTLAELGINVDCVPMLDVRQPDASDIVGDRALGDEPMQVAALGRAVLDGLREGGACGVIKHMPGHGRAAVDSHVEMPVVDAPEEALEVDLAPFQALRDAPMGMTAHVLFTAWDGEVCATHSATIIADIIRGRIGFDGLLMSDDLAMHALDGSPGERASRALAAGCDLALFCTGELAANLDVARAVSDVSAAAADRLARALATIAGARPADDFDSLAAKRDLLLALA